MKLASLLTVMVFTTTAVVALPPNYSSIYGTASVVDDAPTPLNFVTYQPDQHHLEVREAEPEPISMPEALPEPVPEALPEAMPEALPAKPEAVPEPSKVKQAGPPSFELPKSPGKEVHHDPKYGPGPIPGPIESISHKPWKRSLAKDTEAQKQKEAEQLKEYLEAVKKQEAEDLKKFLESELKKPKPSPVVPGFLPGHSGFPVGPIESVSHTPWKRAVPHETEADRKEEQTAEFSEELKEFLKNLPKPKPLPTPVKSKWPPGYSGFPVGPIESVSHKPWKRHIERDALPEAEPLSIPDAQPEAFPVAEPEQDVFANLQPMAVLTA